MIDNAYKVKTRMVGGQGKSVAVYCFKSGI